MLTQAFKDRLEKRRQEEAERNKALETLISASPWHPDNPVMIASLRAGETKLTARAIALIDDGEVYFSGPDADVIRGWLQQFIDKVALDTERAATEAKARAEEKGTEYVDPIQGDLIGHGVKYQQAVIRSAKAVLDTCPQGVIAMDFQRWNYCGAALTALGYQVTSSAVYK
jgi:hypothetical protein